MHLSDNDFLAVIKNTPLVSIDLAVYDCSGQILLGKRKNSPARNTWFVPGGRIKKSETLEDAFMRLSKSELGVALSMSDARLLGVFNHYYDNSNVFEQENVSTQYISIGYRLSIDFDPTADPNQHSEFRWFDPGKIQSGFHDNAPIPVHEYVKLYL